MLNDAQTKEAPVVCYYSQPGKDENRTLTLSLASKGEQVDVDPSDRQLRFTEAIIPSLTRVYEEIVERFSPNDAIQFFMDVIGAGAEVAVMNKLTLQHHKAKNTLHLFRPPMTFQSHDTNETFNKVHEYLEQVMKPHKCAKFCSELALHGICVIADVDPESIFDQQTNQQQN